MTNCPYIRISLLITLPYRQFLHLLLGQVPQYLPADFSAPQQHLIHLFRGLIRGAAKSVHDVVKTLEAALSKPRRLCRGVTRYLGEYTKVGAQAASVGIRDDDVGRDEGEGTVGLSFSLLLQPAP